MYLTRFFYSIVLNTDVLDGEAVVLLHVIRTMPINTGQTPPSHLDPSTLATAAEAEAAVSSVPETALQQQQPEQLHGATRNDGDDATVAHLSSLVVAPSSSPASERLSELRTPTVLSATCRLVRTRTDNMESATGLRDDAVACQPQQRQRTPPLSPIESSSSSLVQPCTLSGGSLVAETSLVVSSSIQWSCGALAVISAAAGHSSSAEFAGPLAAATTNASGASHGCDGSVATGDDDATGVATPTQVLPNNEENLNPILDSSVASITAAAAAVESETVFTESARGGSQVSWTDSVPRRRAYAPSPAELSGFAHASVPPYPARVGRVSSVALPVRGGERRGASTHAAATYDGGESRSSVFTSAGSPLAMQPSQSTPDLHPSSSSPRHTLSRSSVFQSGLFSALDNDAETQTAALDAPMTPQSFSHLLQSRGDSAQQSLMGSRHAATVGGGSPTTGNAPAGISSSSNNVLASSAGRRAFPLPPRAGIAASEQEEWPVSEAVVELHTLDDNVEHVISTAMQQWEVTAGGSGGGSRGSHGTGHTPVVGTLGERQGIAGGSVTPYGSFRLLSSHVELCPSAVSPSCIPTTPTDLENLPWAPAPPAGDTDRRSDEGSEEGDDEEGEDDSSSDSFSTGSSDGTPADKVIETATLVRTRTAAVAGRSSYEVINEKYVLYDYELGKGSYSRVHLCYNVKDRRFYAAKVLDKVRLRRRQLGSDYDLYKMDQEITIMKQLQHRNIIGLREVIRDPNVRYVFLIMELAAGKEVLSMRDNGDVVPLADGRTDYPEATVQHLVRGVLNALRYAHYLGIAHRDVKPSNVLTMADNTVKLCDFGVSVLVGDNTMQLRREGSVAFLAPELLLSSEVDVSRFVSPALSSFGGSKDKTTSESFPTTTSNAPVEAFNSRATEAMEDTAASARHDADEWDFEAPARQQHQQAVTNTRFNQQPPPPQQSHHSHLFTSALTRQPTGDFSEAAGVCSSSGGAPPLAALNAAGPQRSLVASRPSLRTASLSSRMPAPAAAGIVGGGSSGADTAAQYAAWLAHSCLHTTVDLFKGDVFSLGVTVFTLLLGHLPWRASSAASQLAAVLEEPDPFLRLYREAYGDDYAWPPAVQEACAPVLAISRSGSRAGGRPSAPASRVASGGVRLSRGGSGGAERPVMTPLETVTVTTEDDDAAEDAASGAGGAVAAVMTADGSGERRRVTSWQQSSQERRRLTTPPLPRTTGAAATAPLFHRTGSLEVGNVAAALKASSFSPSRPLRSSQPGCTPDGDAITTTTTTTASSATVEQRQWNRSETVGSRHTPRVVQDSAQSPLFGLRSTPSGTDATQQETSGQATPASFWRSVTESAAAANGAAVGAGAANSGVHVLSDRSGSNELPPALAHCVPSSGLDAAVTAQLQMPVSEAANTSVQALEEDRRTAPPAHQLPHWPAVAQGGAASGPVTVSERGDSGTAPALPAWVTTTAAYQSHHEEKSGPGSGEGPEAAAPNTKAVANLPSAQLDARQTARDAGGRKSISLRSGRPPLTMSASDAIAAVALAHRRTRTEDEDDARDGESNAGGSVHGSSGASTTTSFSTERRAALEDSDVLDQSDGEERAGESWNVADDASQSLLDDDEEEEDEDAIYENFYAEFSPCRPYTVSETRPLLVRRRPRDGDDDTDDDTRVISAEAVDFVRACLLLDPAQRRTVFELFHHPWIAGRRVVRDEVTAAGGSGSGGIKTGEARRESWGQQRRSRGASSFTEDDGDEAEEQSGRDERSESFTRSQDEGEEGDADGEVNALRQLLSRSINSVEHNSERRSDAMPADVSRASEDATLTRDLFCATRDAAAMAFESSHDIGRESVVHYSSAPDNGVQQQQQQSTLCAHAELHSVASTSPFHARQPSSSSSRQPHLRSPGVDGSNATASLTNDTSVALTPMTGAYHHTRLPSRDSRVLTDGASLPSPMLEDTADRLLLSGVSPSSPSTTVNSGSAALSGAPWRVASDVLRSVGAAQAAAGRAAAAPTGKATTLSSHSARPLKGRASLRRPARAATTSHVDSFLWRASSDRSASASPEDEEEEEGVAAKACETGELSSMTGSLPELITSVQCASVASPVDCGPARSPSLEEDPPASLSAASRPRMQPQEDTALSSPMRRFLEKISLRDQSL